MPIKAALPVKTKNFSLKPFKPALPVKNQKLFAQAFFQKACGFPKGSALWSRSAERETPYEVRSARGELKNNSANCFERGDAL